MEEPHFTRVVFFEQALRRLEEALAKPEDPIVRDACIQRFEFTFEMAWKAVQSYALTVPSIPNDEEIAQTIYQALPGYTDLLGNLLEKLKAGEIRRAHEEA